MSETKTDTERQSREVGLRVRLPSDLHAKLVKWAQHDERSLNNLIVRMLRRAVEQREQSEDTEENQSAEVVGLLAA